MMSERKFSNSYTSFWTQLLPTVEAFVRQMNLANERFCAPVGSVTKDRDKRSVVNELGFRLFRAKAMGMEITYELKEISERETRSYIERLIPGAVKIPPLSVKETAESERIAAALATCFGAEALPRLDFWPVFQGCGRLESCRGDIINGAILVEVKAGDRNFRVVDVRQVITYLALNFASKQYSLSKVAFINPRICKSYECGIDNLVEHSSGRKAVEVFEDIIEFLSAETGSK
jgi:hypothetical protein